MRKQNENCKPNYQSSYFYYTLISPNILWCCSLHKCYLLFCIPHKCYWYFILQQVIPLYWMYHQSPASRRLLDACPWSPEDHPGQKVPLLPVPALHQLLQQPQVLLPELSSLSRPQTAPKSNTQEAVVVVATAVSHTAAAAAIIKMNLILPKADHQRVSRVQNPNIQSLVQKVPNRKKGSKVPLWENRQINENLAYLLHCSPSVVCDIGWMDQREGRVKVSHRF